MKAGSTGALFRSAALAARRTRSAGDIVLVSPISFAALALAAFAAAAALVAFAVLGSYTKHTTLRGRLLPDRGLIDVHAPQRGTIVQRHAVDGRAVRRGDVLFVISSERTSAALGETHERIGRELASRRRSLRSRIRQTRALGEAEREALEQRARALERELGRLRGMAADQRARVELAEQAARRYARIEAAGFVSLDQLSAKRENLLEQRSRLGNLELEQARLGRELAEVAGEIERLPRRYRNRIAELEGAIARIDVEAARNEARRRVSVLAPANGTAAAVGVEVGQVVDAGTPLASVLPAGARLEARLLAPSRAIGLVDVGNEVRLRYPAFPYQKFGHHPGRVVAVSRSAIQDRRRAVGPATGDREPLYRVVVELDAQLVGVYGEPRALRAGMLVEADVQLETRRLYEWVLEPLYALR